MAVSPCCVADHFLAVSGTGIDILSKNAHLYDSGEDPGQHDARLKDVGPDHRLHAALCVSTDLVYSYANVTLARSFKSSSYVRHSVSGLPSIKFIHVHKLVVEQRVFAYQSRVEGTDDTDQ